MKSLLLLLIACAFVSVASSAPGLVFDEESFDTTSSNRDMAALKRFKNLRHLSNQVSAQEKAFQDSFERDMATDENLYAQTTADSSTALFHALRLAAAETLPKQTREQFWRAVINNVMEQRG